MNRLTGKVAAVTDKPKAKSRAPGKRTYRYLTRSVVAITAIAIAGVLLYSLHTNSDSNPRAEEEGAEAVPHAGTYVGGEACAACHAKQYQAWRGSHHELAMQEATDKTVLGNFLNSKFSYAGVTSTFYKRDEKFFVNTDGADGKLADYEISYTFGVVPLQQYLIKLPGGRLQALSIAWDSRPKKQGGQRWFHLYPNERITHNDELHWTKPAQNWNYMCAECHSTNLQKNYDAANRAYNTTWSEIDVACEACHGPGSHHIEWARAQFRPLKKGGQGRFQFLAKIPLNPPRIKSGAGSFSKGEAVDRADATKGLSISFNERKNIQWTLDARTGKAQRSEDRKTETEIQLCARCHSRRAQLFGDYRHGQPLMDTHLPSLLVEGLYHSDGQIDGEVYEYGSFVQSRMYQAGVTCSDCHDPHSLKLRATGNMLCAQCHAAEKYATAKHHFHSEGKAGSNCVECHMPAKNYMVVDPRRDHSLRVPRPDLSVQIGTPNACNGCHSNKPSQWAASKTREWYGSQPKGYQRYAETLHAARTGAQGAEDRVISLSRELGQPAIARATAVAELGRRLSQQSFSAVVDALNDSDPMVRAAAVASLERVSPEQRWQLAHHLLRDPVRAVRMRVAGLLADVRPESLALADRVELQSASEEYLAAQRQNADDPAAQVNLGNFYAARGDKERAEDAYRAALDLDPKWVPAYVNLADLLRQTSRDPEGEKILRAGIARQPKAAALYHSLALAQVRQKNLPGALASLKRAVDLAPNEPRYNYVYAVALYDAGQRDEALVAINAALKRLPADRSLKELRMQFASRK
jgi:predicted CXXCH cytochrome family protein